jgi:hypothetical protein
MASKAFDDERDQLYARYLANKKIPIAERQRLAYEAAKEYLGRYAGVSDNNAPEMRRFVAEYEKVQRHYTIFTAYTAKNYAKTFELGKSMLEVDPDDFYVLATLAEAGYDDSQSNASTLDSVPHLKKAIQLLDENKVSKPDPFASNEAAQGFLNFALGWALRTQSPVEASKALVRAAQAESPYKSNPLTYNLLGVTILKGEYAQVSAEYNAKFGNKAPSPEQQSMLEKVAHLGDRVVDAYARAVALSVRPEEKEARDKLLARLTTMYKSLHNNSDAGLSEFIGSVLAKPLPQ